MDSNEMEKKIEETVVEILRNADMDNVTEFMVRESALEKLGVNLSAAGYKKFVRQVVESYLLSDQQSNSSAAEAQQKRKEDEKEKQAEEEEDDDEASNKKKRKAGDKEYDDDGDLIICRLSKSGRVTVTEFRGKTLVSMREYYRKEGKEVPTSKGISLTCEQWESFSKNVPAIEKAIKNMESRLN